MAGRIQKQLFGTVGVITLIAFIANSDVSAQNPNSEPLRDNDFVGNKIVSAAESTRPVELPTAESSVAETGTSLLAFVNNALPSKEREANSKANRSRVEQGQTNRKKVSLFDRETPETNSGSEGQRRRDPIDLNQTLKKVGTATALVLVGCCAFLLVAKKLGVGQGGGQGVGNSRAGKKSRVAKENSASISILETRRLAGRCQLKLIEVDGCRFLLAVDGGGVKSLQAVTKSFTASMDEFANETNENNSESDDSPVESMNTKPRLAETGYQSASPDISERLTSLIERI